MEGLKTIYTLEELKAIFNKMDWDNNGEISRIEFKSYLAKLEKGENLDADAVYRAFDKMDIDSSKSLDWVEFMNGMRSLTETQSAVTEDDIERIFNEIDSDGNGFLTPREAKKAHKKLSERFQIDRYQIDEWVKECDFDQDGKISLEEFKLATLGADLVGRDG